MSKTVAIIRVEGLLAKDRNITGTSTPSGSEIAAMLTAAGHVLYYVSEEPNRARVLNWFETERGDPSAKILPSEMDDPIQFVRSLGYDVRYYVDCVPSRIAYALEKGVVGLLVAAPAYMRPEFRPGWRGPVTEWADLTGAIDDERNTKAEDDRGQASLFSD
jgi:hypothetical protein